VAEWPAGIRTRHVDRVNGLRLHLLEAGEPGRPALLLLHGFPELAYSWRKLMPPLAAAGYHVIAPDQRGYGRSSGFDTGYDADLRTFGLRNLVRDAVALLDALGIHRAAAVVGHDFGSPVAAWCALLHPERFASVALMSAPFGGPPAADAAGGDIHAALAALPWPRKHYQRHYTTREANAEMWHCPQGVHAFLRAYYHMKSADWPGNQPHELPGWSAEALAQMPKYYIMDLAMGMAETVAPHLPTPAQIAACRWLTEAELAVYAAEFGRTGFQGGLQWYRCSTHPPCVAELQAHAGRTIDIPAYFIAGASDWGMYQKPGELQRMRSACTRLHGIHVVPGAGHWVQQEQPEAVLRLLQDFLAATWPHCR
jgi:pimeloyl-ACP methyl ester carboxylesterase